MHQLRLCAHLDIQGYTSYVGSPREGIPLFLLTQDTSAGTRHVKIWRIHEHRSISPSKQRLAADAKTQPSPASPSVSNPLPGRNCLLGSLVDSTFTCVVRSMDDRAIVCSEKGDICLIEENEGNQRLVKIEEAGFGITSIATDPESKYVWLGGLGGIK